MGGKVLLLLTVICLTTTNSMTARYRRDTVDHHEDTAGDGHEDGEHGHSNSSHNGGEHHHGHGVTLAGWEWEELGSIVANLLMLMLAVLIKTYYHRLPVISEHVPETCFLILLGVLISTILYYGLGLDWVRLGDDVNDEDKDGNPIRFTNFLFFNVLLPPIILDSAFSLYSRDFLSNIPSIMTFAILGTILNTFAVGISLQVLAWTGLLGTLDEAHPNEELEISETLIFSSLIAAVDPVAVLSIFDEIGVNSNLYFLVFGESLFNDGVSVVLYNSMLAISNLQTVGAVDITLAFFSFFFVVFGGLGIGTILGVLVSLISTTTQSVREIEPYLLFVFAYFSYIAADLVEWSGILSLIAFGLVIKRYAMVNVSRNSHITVQSATRTLASVSDSVIFIFLGMTVVSEAHNLHWVFIISVIIFCTLYRFIGTYVQCLVLNRLRSSKISMKDQFIMSYGGLRGAVGFSLAIVLEDGVWYKDLFVTAALAMVFFTCFVQGTTIKSLVRLLNIRLQGDKDENFTSHIQMSVMDDIMAGIEILAGRSGHYRFGRRFNEFEKKFINRYLLVPNSSVNDSLENVLEHHYTNLYAPTIIAKEILEENEQKEPGKETRSFSDQHMKNEWNRIFLSPASGEAVGDGEDLLSIQMRKKQDRTRTMESRLTSRPGLTISSQDVKTKYGQVAADKKRRISTKPSISHQETSDLGDFANMLNKAYK